MVEGSVFQQFWTTCNLKMPTQSSSQSSEKIQTQGLFDLPWLQTDIAISRERQSLRKRTRFASFLDNHSYLVRTPNFPPMIDIGSYLPTLMAWLCTEFISRRIKPKRVCLSSWRKVAIGPPKPRISSSGIST